MMDEQCMKVVSPSGVEMNASFTSQSSPKIVSADLDSKGVASKKVKCILQKRRENADEGKSKDDDDTTSTCGLDNVRQAIRMTRALSFPQKVRRTSYIIISALSFMYRI